MPFICRNCRKCRNGLGLRAGQELAQDTAHAAPPGVKKEFSKHFPGMVAAFAAVAALSTSRCLKKALKGLKCRSPLAALLRQFAADGLSMVVILPAPADGD
ncbi:hypothetical protein GJ668_17200 [Allochromatium palmeri]|uniref:Uncharacterized protein n=1 Tax=Allochromatium palmeri TaxID=231048 RepID=A0A6N8EGP9_9GAMM|nr:hypothetical protein [Allochromatium palmeri]